MTSADKRGKNGITILVVDDSAYNRKVIRAMLDDMEEVGEVKVASDGEEAIRVVVTDPPDVITLDLNMPRMDGFTFLRWLMRNSPIPVVVVSAEGGEKNVFKALDLGAFEFVVKPYRYASERIVEIRQELQEKVRAVAGKDVEPYLNRLKVKRTKLHAPSVREAIDETESAPAKEGLLVIGASTGGPSAVQRVLTELPENFPLPVVVIQHMPPVFTKQFAKRLERNTALKSREAADGDVLKAGTVFVAPGGQHLLVDSVKKGVLKIVEKTDKDRFIPSVDKAMISAAEAFGDAVIGVLLTGMGNDGAEGLRRIKDAGGYTIAESEESSVVYGMPRAAVQKDAAVEVAHIDMIGLKLADLGRHATSLKNKKSGGTKEP